MRDERRFSGEEINTLVASPLSCANDGDNDEDWKEDEEEKKKRGTKDEDEEEKKEPVWLTLRFGHALNGPRSCAYLLRRKVAPHCAQFTVAASEYLQALSEQLKSVTLGNGFRLETEIAAARQRKDEATYAILKHESEHGW